MNNASLVSVMDGLRSSVGCDCCDVDEWREIGSRHRFRFTDRYSGCRYFSGDDVANSRYLSALATVSGQHSKALVTAFS